MKKTLLSIVGIIALLFACGAAFFYFRFHTHADIQAYRAYFATPVSTADQAATPGTRVTAMFMGVSTVLLSDGETNLLTDGFFTHPSALRFLTTDIGPDRAIIARSLKRANITKLDAVMVVHSHFDHSMDAPIVAANTGALLLGSESTANVGRGLKLPENKIRVVKTGRPMRFGKFTVTFHESKHYKLPDWIAKKILNQEIKAPLKPPVDGFDYKEGKTYSIHVQHPSGNVLIHGSAGFIPGALKNVRAHTVFLGTGGAGSLSIDEFNAYLKETVFTVGARRVIPIHWDDMFQPVHEPLKASRDFPASMKRIIADSKKGKAYEIKILPEWKRVRLF